MKLRFSKYHGAGNDFIMVDNRDGNFNPDAKQIAALCHRRFGIGADGLILMNRIEGYDFGMKYYNSDGRESTMCGNGGRCLTAFAASLSLSGDQYHFLAADGVHHSTINKRDGDNYLVRLSMNDVNEVNEYGNDFILNTGSPHYVRIVDDVSSINVPEAGRKIRYFKDFREEGINVNFVQQDGERIFVRTYERGVEDETLSCGTGVTASALVYASINKIIQGSISVVTKGGSLEVHFIKSPGGFTGIFLEGPAKQVFTGIIDLEELIDPGSEL